MFHVLENICQKVHVFTGKMNKFWRCDAQQSDCRQQYSVTNLKVAKRLDLRCSQQKYMICEAISVLAKAVVVIMLQYTNVSIRYIVHKLPQY